MATGLAEAGADIVGVSASLTTGTSVIRAAVEACGRQFYPFKADLSQREEVYALIEKIQTAFPLLDILVNNAGSIRRAPAAHHSDAYWDEVLAINLDAPFLLAREVGKLMLAQGQGKIIFTASLLSFQGGLTVPGYAASKGAIASLIKALANEWAGQGIQVNGIAPGYIATDNTAPLRADAARNASILSRIPAGRWGDPDDFKGPVVFLASDAANYINGTILTVDGGWMGR